MDICAIQKTTLLDYPGKVACTVFVSGCNLRCPFCHNSGLVLPDRTPSPAMSQEELLAFLSRRTGKLDGVCISGGEPTLYPDLPELIWRIRQLGFSVKLDTNGTNPQMLELLIRQRAVDHIAMDIKNSPDRYRETCGGIDVFPLVEKSAALLLSSDIPYEFRTTVCQPLHTQKDIRQIGRWLRGAKAYVLQQFVDSGNLIGQGLSALTEAELYAMQEILLTDIPNTQIRGI